LNFAVCAAVAGLIGSAGNAAGGAVNAGAAGGSAGSAGNAAGGANFPAATSPAPERKILPSVRFARAETLATLAEQFTGAPADVYKPQCWWHWMGSNISREGITKDLEAMREAGVAGAVIFNVGTFLPRGKDSRWPERTYRSEQYWELFGHALAEARRLGLKIGLHNCAGWSETGGPWISEARSMQVVTTSKLDVTIAAGAAGKTFNATLPKPPVPRRHGRFATFTKDIALYAVPAGRDARRDDVRDLTAHFNSATGELNWPDAPAGAWTLVRVAHGSNAARPGPVPGEIEDISYEADKFSRAENERHWDIVLKPLTERFGEFIGTTFTNIWVDSYEAGNQNWSPVFRAEFIRQKGYDPLPWIALQNAVNAKRGQRRDDTDVFNRDWKAVTNRLILDNSWRLAKEKVNAAGFDYYQEPYETSLFDTTEATSIPDVPVTEFWTQGNGDYHFIAMMDKAIRTGEKRIIAAEAFTTWPGNANFTEDPAFLKRTADGAFRRGANLYFLHSWVHQPYDDTVQPGLGLGPFGVHFGRHQPWHPQSKAFFTYLARCQMLLQQGTLADITPDYNHRRTPEADIFFINNDAAKTVAKTCALPVTVNATGTAAKIEVWDAYNGTISTLPANALATSEKTTGTAGDAKTTTVTLTLPPRGSLFLVIPRHATPYAKRPALTPKTETATAIAGPWRAAFAPKLRAPFTRELPALADLSKSTDPALRYFSGTVTYRTTIEWGLSPRSLHILDLGALEDAATLRVNGRHVAHLWHPPYRADITPFLRAGTNEIEVAVAVNWANALIGDEQFPPDYERTGDGRRETPAMKQFPDWFLNNQPRPEPRRRTFTPVVYFRKDSKPYPAGLLGPVRLIRQTF
jgi:hypothetical protein